MDSLRFLEVQEAPSPAKKRSESIRALEGSSDEEELNNLIAQYQNSPTRAAVEKKKEEKKKEEKKPLVVKKKEERKKEESEDELDTVEGILKGKYKVKNPLPSFLLGLVVCVQLKDLSVAELVKRHIVAFGGMVLYAPSKNVKCIISDKETKKNGYGLPMVSVDFITACIAQKKLLESTPYVFTK